MVTIKEIANLSGVSVATVSNILNGKPKVSEETRSRVLGKIKELGYQPNYIAQGLRSQKTHTICIIAEDIMQFTTPGIIESIMAFFEQNGYRTIVQNMRLYMRWSDEWFNNDEEYNSALSSVLQETLSIKVDGVIYIAGHARVIHCFPEDFGIPSVMVYGYTKSARYPSVVINDEQGGHDIVQHLIECGHRKIGVLAGCDYNIHTQKRLLGYQRALFEHGIPYDPDLVSYEGWMRENGYAGAGKLLGKKDITALFCMSDAAAGGVYDYMKKHGIRCTEDISIAGFDNQVMADYLDPALTTMELPLSEIGKSAAMRLFDMIEKDAGPDENIEEIYVPCRMIVRDSVKTL